MQIHTPSPPPPVSITETYQWQEGTCTVVLGSILNSNPNSLVWYCVARDPATGFLAAAEADTELEVMVRMTDKTYRKGRRRSEPLGRLVFRIYTAKKKEQES